MTTDDRVAKLRGLTSAIFEFIEDGQRCKSDEVAFLYVRDLIAAEIDEAVKAARIEGARIDNKFAIDLCAMPRIDLPRVRQELRVRESDLKKMQVLPDERDETVRKLREVLLRVLERHQHFYGDRCSHCEQARALLESTCDEGRT